MPKLFMQSSYRYPQPLLVLFSGSNGRATNEKLRLLVIQVLHKAKKCHSTFHPGSTLVPPVKFLTEVYPSFKGL